MEPGKQKRQPKQVPSIEKTDRQTNKIEGPPTLLEQQQEVILGAHSITGDQASEASGGGATKERASCWSITLNNPTKDDIEHWERLPSNYPIVKKAVGQVERGENGTVHIQGLLHTEQVRFSAVKKILPKAHIEVARNPVALAQYVRKEGTRVRTLNTTKYSPQQYFQESLFDYCDEIFTHKIPVMGMKGKTSLSDCKYYDWKQDLAPMEGNTVLELYLKQHAGEIIDKVINKMILQRKFDIAFCMGNNQARSVYLRSLSSFLYIYAYPQANPDAQEEGNEAPTPPEEIDEA